MLLKLSEIWYLHSVYPSDADKEKQKLIYIFFRFFLLILTYFRLFSSYVGDSSPPKFFLMKSGKYVFSSLIMPKHFQLVLFKNIILFYVNQSNHLLTLTSLGGYFTPLNRLLADKKKYVSLSFWSPTTYIKIIKIEGGHLGYFTCKSKFVKVSSGM